MSERHVWLEGKAVASWREADAARNRAEDRALGLAKRALKPGTMVRWKHGNHWRSGVVEEVVGFRYEHAAAFITSFASGKRVRIYLSAILSNA